MFPTYMRCLRLVPLITVLVGGTLHALSPICADLEKLIPLVIVNVIEIRMTDKDHL